MSSSSCCPTFRAWRLAPNEDLMVRKCARPQTSTGVIDLSRTIALLPRVRPLPRSRFRRCLTCESKVKSQSLHIKGPTSAALPLGIKSFSTFTAQASKNTTTTFTMPQAQPELKKVGSLTPTVPHLQPSLTVSPVPRQAPLRATQRQPKSPRSPARLRCTSLLPPLSRALSTA